MKEKNRGDSAPDVKRKKKEKPEQETFLERIPHYSSIFSRRKREEGTTTRRTDEEKVSSNRSRIRKR